MTRTALAALVLADYKAPGKRFKLHDVQCPWATGGHTGDYVVRPRTEFAPDHPVCGRCGGPGSLTGAT